MGFGGKRKKSNFKSFYETLFFVGEIENSEELWVRLAVDQETGKLEPAALQLLGGLIKTPDEFRLKITPIKKPTGKATHLLRIAKKSDVEAFKAAHGYDKPKDDPSDEDNNTDEVEPGNGRAEVSAQKMPWE